MNKARHIVRSLALLLALCLVLAWFPAQAMAEEEPIPTSGTCGENLTWELDLASGTLTISGTGDMDNSFANLNAESWRDSIKSIIIEPGVTSIAVLAFQNCQSLISVTVPSTVTSISTGGVHAWGSFFDCRSLQGIWVDEQNSVYTSDEYGVLFNKDMTMLLQAPGGLQGDYSIPETVTNLDSYAFDGCAGLTGITIPAGVTYIDKCLFEGCTGLTSITIPESVNVISYYAFNGCTGLKEVTFKGDAPSVPEWYTRPFDGVTATAYYPAGNDTWTEEAMQSYGDSLTWVPYGASIDYSFIDGQDSQWNAEDGGGLTFRADGEFDKFDGVSVDDTTVDPSNYTAKSGSTIITFTEGYLKTLSAGEHTLTVTFTDGAARTTFTVNAAPEAPSDPSTPTQPNEQPAEQPSEPATEPDEQPAEQPSEPVTEPNEQPAEQPSQPATEPEETSAGTDETTAPTEPATPSDNPKTGENTLAPWLAMLLVSGLGIVAIVAYRRKLI